ncbi:MAG: Hpt domain-containing protein [Candidatus Zhuqueibacterota bacterium]
MLPDQYKNHASIQDVIHNRFRGNFEFYLKMITLFFDTLHEYLKNIEDGIASDEHEKVKFAAHSIKGSAANLGVSSLQAISERLEHRATDLSSSGTLFDLFRELKAELQEFRDYSATLK